MFLEIRQLMNFFVSLRRYETTAITAYKLQNNHTEIESQGDVTFKDYLNTCMEKVATNDTFSSPVNKK
jgi:hypothetical protein